MQEGMRDLVLRRDELYEVVGSYFTDVRLRSQEPSLVL